MPIGDYRAAFPDYDDDLPEIEGFADMSWHNEPCPCLINEQLHLRLMVDYADPALREYEGTRRYGLYRLDGDNQITEISDEPLIDSDDLDEILAKIDEIRNNLPGPN